MLIGFLPEFEAQNNRWTALSDRCTFSTIHHKGLLSVVKAIIAPFSSSVKSFLSHFNRRSDTGCCCCYYFWCPIYTFLVNKLISTDAYFYFSVPNWVLVHPYAALWYISATMGCFQPLFIGHSPPPSPYSSVFVTPKYANSSNYP